MARQPECREGLAGIAPDSQVFDLWPGRNPWQVPTLSSCFGIWLEGEPSPTELAEMEEEVARKRREWAPSEEAWSLLWRLDEALTGRWIEVAIWHDIIVAMDEDEGFRPLRGLCSLVGHFSRA